MFTAAQVNLEDNTTASMALETDPPGHVSARITGVYTFPATTGQDAFRADVGFCFGTASGAQMEYKVFVGSEPTPAASGTLDTTTGQLTHVEVPLQPGTTQVTLEVDNNPGIAPYADVVWFDPRIEAADAPSPLPRPSFTPTPSPTA